MTNETNRGRLVAVITGVFSIAIGIIYLILIAILDSRGPMLLPPPEALGAVATVFCQTWFAIRTGNCFNFFHK